MSSQLSLSTLCALMSVTPSSTVLRWSLTLQQPTGKTLEEIDQLFAKDDAVLEHLSHPMEKSDVQEVENAP